MALTRLVVVVLCGIIATEGALTDTTSQNAVSQEESVKSPSSLEGVSTQKPLTQQGSVEDSSTLAEMLKQYLVAIETIEATGSPCVQDHRSRLTRAQTSLRTKYDRCSTTGVSDDVSRCLEDSSKTDVSDVRQGIVQLKACVDEC